MRSFIALLTLSVVGCHLIAGLDQAVDAQPAAGGAGNVATAVATSASSGGSGGNGGSGGMACANGGAAAMSGYSDTIIADMPMAYWRLGDRGGVAVDESGANNGQYVGNIIQQSVMGAIACDRDTAVHFSGETSVITFGDVFDVQDVSLEAWINPDLADLEYRFIISKITPDNQQGYGLFLQSQDGLGFEVIRDGAYTSAVTAEYTRRTWQHVVGTWNGTTARIYVNGVEKHNSMMPRTLLGTVEPFKIGAFTNTGLSGFKGTIDEVAIYDRELASAEIVAHYQAGTR